MLWFLYSLLHESAPATCYWIVPVRRELDVNGVASLVSSESGECAIARESEPADYYRELLEIEGYAKEHVCGLIVVNVCTDPALMGGSSI